ncbi:MAG: hypothetical protein KA792_03930 [Bacteroidales bacterium]|nr:hypothetical protein [Bacteroidales bacterium]
MKNKTLILLALFGLIYVTSCKKDKDDSDTTKSLLPSKMTVDIPEALNYPEQGKKATATDSITPIKGNDIYRNLRTFINVGAGGAKIVNDIIYAVAKNNITKIQEATFTGEDGKTKYLKVYLSPKTDSITWQYGLTIKDFDNSNAFQLFWNQKPIKGIAIFHIAKFDHNNLFGKLHPYGMIRIDYSEDQTNYDKQMIVSIANLKTYTINDINNMKMFVGKKGNNLDIYGNSNHPTALLIDSKHQGGFNWAFVAHADDNLNIGVAEVALPVCNYDKLNNLLTDFSIKKVLAEEINNVYGGVLSQQELDSLSNIILKNAEAPGYFIGKDGFVSCGSNIPSNSGFSQAFIDLSALNPYIPKNINDLEIKFYNY